MDMVILKTDINSKSDFTPVEDSLRNYYSINECTIDLHDCDKVMRVTGNNLDRDDIISQINRFGFKCEELM